MVHYIIIEKLADDSSRTGFSGPLCTARSRFDIQDNVGHLAVLAGINQMDLMNDSRGDRQTRNVKKVR